MTFYILQNYENIISWPPYYFFATLHSLITFFILQDNYLENSCFFRYGSCPRMYRCPVAKRCTGPDTTASGTGCAARSLTRPDWRSGWQRSPSSGSPSISSSCRRRAAWPLSQPTWWPSWPPGAHPPQHLLMQETCLFICLLLKARIFGKLM